MRLIKYSQEVMLVVEANQVSCVFLLEKNLYSDTGFFTFYVMMYFYFSDTWEKILFVRY